MILLKSIRNRHLHQSLLKLQNPSNYFKNPPQKSNLFPFLASSNSSRSSLLSSILSRPFSLSAHFVQTSNGNRPKIEKPLTSPKIAQTPKANTPKSGKPLSIFFKEAVGILEKNDLGEVEAETVCENAELKEKLRKLAEEVDSLDTKKPEKGKVLKPRSKNVEGVLPSDDKRRLSDCFAYKRVKREVKLDPIDHGNEDHKVYKALSSDMEILANHLYARGYLKNANFMPKDKFDSTCFETSYARDYLKRAAVDFGRDHQEIAKWLSASDLKTIATFGCPSLGEKSVGAAKHLRSFFKVDEQQVCQKCILKKSCKLANKKSRTDPSKLRLGDVTRVLVMYALESVPQQLVVPEEVKSSASRLLKEVISLSDTVSKDVSKTPDLE